MKELPIHHCLAIFFLFPAPFTALPFFHLRAGEHNRARPSGRRGFDGEIGRKRRAAALGQRQTLKEINRGGSCFFPLESIFTDVYIEQYVL